jgi:transposase InsO family protein
VSRFQFVEDHRATYEVKRLCELVEIERSSYYAWRNAAPARTARAAADAELADRIRLVHAQDNTAGAPRMTAELNDGAAAGERVNHKRVARVMRQEHIRGYQRRRRVRTTIPQPSGQQVPDLLQRDFTAPAPNCRYVGDIKCRRRHLMSYADLGTMPTSSAIAQVNSGTELRKVGIVA